MISLKNISEEAQNRVNNHNYISNRKIDYKFVAKHYAKLYSFANELHQQLGITVKEDLFIRSSKNYRFKFERHSGQAAI